MLRLLFIGELKLVRLYVIADRAHFDRLSCHQVMIFECLHHRLLWFHAYMLIRLHYGNLLLAEPPLELLVLLQDIGGAAKGSDILILRLAHPLLPLVRAHGRVP